MATASNNKVEDDFLYPIPIAGSGEGDGEGSGGLRFTNALDAVYSLYQHAGAIAKTRFNPKEAKGEKGTGESSDSLSSAPKPITKMDPAVKANWFKYNERVIPGGVMKLVDSITIPTPKGWSTTTSARLNQLFDRRYLIEFEDKAVLSQFTYTELDELRFAYTAVFDLVTGGHETILKTQISIANLGGGGVSVASSSTAASASPSASAAAAACSSACASPSFYAAQTQQAAINSKVFESMWGLQGLAKRDIKKNCDTSGGGGDGGASSSSAADAPSAGPAGVVVAGKQKVGVAKGGTGSSGLVRTDASKERPKLAAEKKHAKALLEDECVKLWPHTPANKAAVFTLDSDPNQPRHKPLYRATVELTMMNKRKVEGPPMGNKKDAEDAAAELVLKFLYTSSFGKKK